MTSVAGHDVGGDQDESLVGTAAAIADEQAWRRLTPVLSLQLDEGDRGRMCTLSCRFLSYA